MTVRELSANLPYACWEGAFTDGELDRIAARGDLAKRRKLSMPVQVSDPSSYDGCDLQFHAANHIDTAPRMRGAVIAFPSYVLHRVTPITRGIRKSMVVWTTGPKFR
ncbi:MAG TPA: hypothetical protein VGG66_08130 [Rhizomicrobium sp.]